MINLSERMNPRRIIIYWPAYIDFHSLHCASPPRRRRQLGVSEVVPQH